MKKQKKLKRGLNNRHMYVYNEDEGIDEFFDLDCRGKAGLIFLAAGIGILSIWIIVIILKHIF